MIEHHLRVQETVSENCIGNASVYSFLGQLVQLHINPVDFDFHIDWHMDTSSEVMMYVLGVARSRGYEPIPFDECDDEPLGSGWMRTYMVPVEPIRDTPLEDELPDLNLTAYGPFSGVIPKLALVASSAALLGTDLFLQLYDGVDGILTSVGLS